MTYLIIGLICIVAIIWAHTIRVRVEHIERRIDRIYKEESDRREWSEFYNRDQVTNEKAMNE